MNPPNNASLESRLTRALRQEVSIAMTLTDTPKELDRFQRTTKRRRRLQVFAAAAVVAAIVAGITTAVALSQSGSSTSTPINHPSKPARVHHHQAALGFGTPKALPASVPVQKLSGPQNLGITAFGGLWATAGTSSSAHLYEVSQGGNRVLVDVHVPGINDNFPAPVRIGHTIVVADGVDSRYSVFGPTGTKLGSLAGTQQPVAAGDATGGWVTTNANRVARVDATGLHIVRQIQLPNAVTVAGIATSPGALWVIDSSSNRLLRVTTSTGKISGQLKLPAIPFQVNYFDAAVYVATEDYGLRRVDPTTMTVTASIFSRVGLSWPVMASPLVGQLWVQPEDGAAVQLNPTSLKPIRSIKVFPDTRSGGTFGVISTSSRVYVTNGDTDTLYSFPQK